MDDVGCYRKCRIGDDASQGRPGNVSLCSYCCSANTHTGPSALITCAVKGAVRATPTCRANVGSTISIVDAIEIVINCAEVLMPSGHPLNISKPVATAIISR